MRINFLGKFFVRPFVTKPVRCYPCQRFGHLAAACLAKKERCSMCSGHHRTQQCLGKIQNSESVDLKCANCGEKHSANSNHCSVLWEKMQLKMNIGFCIIMYINKKKSYGKILYMLTGPNSKFSNEKL